MAFRAEMLRAIGGFDPALGNGTPALGGVDSEVLLRTVVLGHRLVYRPNAMVWHDHRADYADLRRQVYSYGAGLTAYLLKTVTDQPDRPSGVCGARAQGNQIPLAAGIGDEFAQRR